MTSCSPATGVQVAGGTTKGGEISAQSSPDLEQDRADILKVHKDWWEANTGLDIPRMQSCYPSGMAYLMFNLNGHPYFGIEEKTTLWEWYQKELDIPKLPDIEIMRLEINGDQAWIAAEGIFPLRAIGASGTGSETWQLEGDEGLTPFRLRATEIYHRDDGEGNPVWKMWHFHCSPLPPEDEPRPAFGDTPAERGLGGGPTGPPLRVAGA
jgi:hypothetical protein